MDHQPKNKHYLASEELPTPDVISVEVYGRSMGKDYKQRAWVQWGARFLEPWHIWRYSGVPSTKLRDKASLQRRKCGAVACPKSGYFEVKSCA